MFSHQKNIAAFQKAKATSAIKWSYQEWVELREEIRKNSEPIEKMRDEQRSMLFAKLTSELQSIKKY